MAAEGSQQVIKPEKEGYKAETAQLQKPQMKELKDAVRKMPADQVQTLLTDESLFASQFGSEKEIECLNKVVEKHAKDVQDLAGSNQKTKQELEGLAEKYEVKYAEFDSLRTSYD